METNRTLDIVYSHAKDLFQHKGYEFEDISILKTLDALREFWKPEKVKVLLLAESHVRTSIEENQIQIDLNKISTLLKHPDTLLQMPLNYAGLVYCLGYGINEILTQKALKKNGGTPQFWQIFYSCINQITSQSDFQYINKTGKPKVQLSDHLGRKIELLLKMKEKGIWLLDTSIFALYPKPLEKSLIKSLLSFSWKQYIYPKISECQPERICLIGKSFSQIVLQDLSNFQTFQTNQPQAHLTKDESLEQFKKYYQICNL
jgi:hypothetical protein